MVTLILVLPALCVAVLVLLFCQLDCDGLFHSLNFEKAKM